MQFDELKKDIEKSTWAFYLRLGRQELDAVPRCGGSPWPSSPFEKGGRAASLNFLSLAAGQEGPTMAPPGGKRNPWAAGQGMGSYFSAPDGPKKSPPLGPQSGRP